MAIHRLSANDFESDYNLIAIHSQSEPYKLAFQINLKLKTKLKKSYFDISFKNNNSVFDLYKHVSEVFNEMASIMPSLNNITWDRVDKEESVTYPCEGKDQPGTEIVFSQNFPTQSGLGKIVPTNLISPHELPDQDFPFVLTTGRLLEHWHTGSMTRKSKTLDKIEPEAIVSMNSQDMHHLNLEPGNRVNVKTRRGSVKLSVRQDRELPKGMIFIPFCYSEAAVNFLTNPALDPFGKIPELKFSAACLQKVDEYAAAE